MYICNFLPTSIQHQKDAIYTYSHQKEYVVVPGGLTTVTNTDTQPRMTYRKTHISQTQHQAVNIHPSNLLYTSV